jgi:hypothetical protein
MIQVNSRIDDSFLTIENLNGPIHINGSRISEYKKLSNGIIYVSDKVKEKLPKHIQPYVEGNENQIRIKYWCMTELGVPPYPEKRNFESIANTFYTYSLDKSEIYFEFIPKIKVNF